MSSRMSCSASIESKYRDECSTLD